MRGLDFRAEGRDTKGVLVVILYSCTVIAAYYQQVQVLIANRVKNQGFKLRFNYALQFKLT